MTKKASKVKNSQQEESILEESLHFVQNLSDEVKKMAKTKDLLKKKVESLDKKISVKETQQKAKNITDSIKNEVMKDFMPVLDKLNISKVKKHIEDSLKELIELEVQKVRTEITSKTNKNRKDFTQKLSSLEADIIEALQNDKKITNKLTTLEKNKLSQITKQLEQKINQEITKSCTITNTQLDELKLELKTQKTKSSQLDTKITKIKKQLEKDLNVDSQDFASIQSKIQKLEKQNKSIKSLVEKYEDELFNRKKDESLDVEKKVKEVLKDTQTQLKKIQKDKQESKDYFEKELKQLKSNINVFEKELNKKTNKKSKNTNDKLHEQIDKLKNEIDKIQLTTKESLELLEVEKKQQKQFLEKEYNNVVADLENIESKYESVAKVELTKLQKELETNIIDKFNTLKKNAVTSDNKREKKVDEEIQKFVKYYEDYFKKVDNKYKKISKNLEKSIMSSTQSFIKNKDYVENQVNKFKLEISKFTKQHFDKIAKELDALNKKTKEVKSDKQSVLKLLEKKINQDLKVFDKKLDEVTKKSLASIQLINDEKDKSNQYLLTKVDEFSQEFEQLKQASLKHIEENLIAEIQNIKEEFIDMQNQSKEELSKQLIANNKFVNDIKTQLAKAQLDMSENIENKFVETNKQYQQEFVKINEMFKQELNLKEKDFFSKVQDLYNKKDALVLEMDQYKQEIGVLTKEYINKLDDELNQIKVVHKDFEQEKEAFDLRLEGTIKAKKEELKSYSDQLSVNIKDIIEEQKSRYENQESNFKELFREKISNLKELTVSKLDKIEKRFVDKNLKYVEDRVKSQLEYLNLFEERLKSKEEEIVTQLNILDDTKNMLHEEFTGEFENLNQKVENRLTTYEQKLNKRFLDFDSMFTSFKSVVIDEVEGLMREVSQLTQSRIDTFDQDYQKFTKAKQEVANHLTQIVNAKKVMELEFRDVRDEINDVRVRLDVGQNLGRTPMLENNSAQMQEMKDYVENEVKVLKTQMHTIQNNKNLKDEILQVDMHSLISNMAEYESHLIDLVTSLRAKGIDDESIKTALINKGHPRMYAMMILDNLDKVYN